RLTYDDLFVQASINHDNTSGSYFLPTGAPIVDRSTTYTAQIQHHWDPVSKEKLTYGADYESIRPITDSTLYGPDDGHANVSILGAYLQSETSLLDNDLDLVLAGRLDKHSALTNPIFSPRAALVYHLDQDNSLRAMYNVTYLFPSITDLFADLLYADEAPYSVRYVSPYVSGYSFTPNADGSYNMNTPLPAFDSMPQIPSTMTTTQAQAKLWPVVMDLAAKAANQPLLKVIPAPTQNVSYLAYANVGSNAGSEPFIPIPNGVPQSISPVQPQHQVSYELDYQGALSKSFQLEVDAYETHYSVIHASTVALTPVVVFDSAKLQQYFVSEFGNAIPQSSIDSLAGELSHAPLGVVQANGGAQNESYPDDILVGTRSYLQNTITFYGVDLFGTYKANKDWSFDGSFSYLNKNYWYAAELNPQDSTIQAPFALNLPKYRFSLGAKYSGLARGLSLELRDRWSDAFQMVDNYWIGNVGAWNVLDLTVNYNIESWNNLLLTLSITNVLDNVHEEFVGAPYIGRLTMLRASYALPAL
ncbi:MAG TPA: TonB-dependent receptor, partial [Candidatus Kapabacteria bacterium]